MRSFNLSACFLAGRKRTRMPTSQGVVVRIKGGNCAKHWCAVQGQHSCS